MIPVDYIDYIKELPLPWDEIEAAAATYNVANLTKEDLKQWLRWYVMYHNIVIEAAQNTTDLAGFAGELILPEVFNMTDLNTILENANETIRDAFLDLYFALEDIVPSTSFYQMLDFEQIWNSTFEAMDDVKDIFDALSTSHILWETYALYDLFFAPQGFGVLTST